MKSKKITSILMAIIMIFTISLGSSTVNAEDANREMEKSIEVGCETENAVVVKDTNVIKLVMGGKWSDIKNLVEEKIVISPKYELIGWKAEKVDNSKLKLTEDTLINENMVKFLTAIKLRAETTGDTIYLNTETRNDNNDGISPSTSVKSFTKAKEIATKNQNIKKIDVYGKIRAKGKMSLKGTNAS